MLVGHNELPLFVLWMGYNGSPKRYVNNCLRINLVVPVEIGENEVREKTSDAIVYWNYTYVKCYVVSFDKTLKGCTGCYDVMF